MKITNINNLASLTSGVVALDKQAIDDLPSLASKKQELTEQAGEAAQSVYGAAIIFKGVSAFGGKIYLLGLGTSNAPLSFVVEPSAGEESYFV